MTRTLCSIWRTCSCAGAIWKGLKISSIGPFYLGVLKERQGKYAEAAESLERSLSMQDNPAARFSLAVLRIYHLNDKTAGRAQLEAALKSPDLTGDLKKLVETELAKL